MTRRSCYTLAVVSKVVVTVAAMLVLASTSASARMGSRVPPTVELEGCVMPTEACTASRDTIHMKVEDRTLEFRVERLTFPTSGASGSKALTELKLRGVSVHGPKPLLAKLVPGTVIRLRGTLRTGPYLLLQSVEPRAER